MADEATLVLIKPDAIQRGLTGTVLARLEQTGLRLLGAKIVRVNRALAEAHYQDLRRKPFFEEIVRYLCGELHGTEYVWVLVYAGPSAIDTVRKLAGATNPEQADPRSLRGAYGRITTAGVMENILHASSDLRESRREIPLWFRPEELLEPVELSGGRAASPKAARA